MAEKTMKETEEVSNIPESSNTSYFTLQYDVPAKQVHIVEWKVPCYIARQESPPFLVFSDKMCLILKSRCSGVTLMLTHHPAGCIQTPFKVTAELVGKEGVLLSVEKVSVTSRDALAFEFPITKIDSRKISHHLHFRIRFQLLRSPRSKFQSKSPTKPSPRRPIHGDSKEDERKRKENYHDKKDSEGLYPKKKLDEVPEAELDEEVEEVIRKSKASDKFDEENEQSLFSFFKYLLVVLLVLFPAYWFGVRPQSSDLSSSLSLDQILDNVQNNFKNQNPFTYRILRSALRKVVDVSHEPSAPAIITVIANKNAESKAPEFSLYLAKALVGQNYVLINESAYFYSNSDDIKLMIDEGIKSKVENDTLSVVVVDKLHNIPYEAAMIFHGYCDHQLAPYKRAVFLFNVPLDVILPEDASNKQIDAAAMRQLRNIWNRATDDIIDSLIIRMTVNVVNIR